MRTKLALLAVVASSLPSAVVGLVLIDVNENALSRINEELMFSVIDDVAGTIDRALVRHQDALDSVARTLEASDHPIASRIALAKALVAGTEDVSRVGIYGTNGSLIDAISETSEEAAESSNPNTNEDTNETTALPETLSEAMRTAADTRGRALGPAVFSQDKARLLLAVPVRGEGQTWYAVSWLSLNAVQERVFEIVERRFEGDTESLFVLDRSLRVVSRAGATNTLGTQLPREGMLVQTEGDAFARGLAVFGPFSRTRTAGGAEKMVGALRNLPSLPWMIYVQQPYAVAYASIGRMRNIIVAAVVVVILLSVLVAVRFARRLSRPISDLVTFADDLAARRFDKRIAINTRDELSVLGNAMSHAAHQLEESERRIRSEVEIRSTLGRYLPGRLVDNIVERKQDLTLGGQRRPITVLFADVAGFTPLAEKHAADDVVKMLNQLFTLLTEIVFRHQGTVDKFIGDCVMAFWGAPDFQEDHSERALAAAEDMLRFLEAGNESWQKEFGITINLAIGVNTGEAVVGNFGSENRMEYTAIGDVVNVAARLESIARPQQILITEETKRAAGDSFEYRAVGTRKLAGRERAVELHEVVV